MTDTFRRLKAILKKIRPFFQGSGSRSVTGEKLTREEMEGIICLPALSSYRVTVAAVMLEDF